MSTGFEIVGYEVLSNDWYMLKKITYRFKNSEGIVKTQSREAYDRGNGATILLYNTFSQTVILTRQFRLPTFINGNPSGMLLEACAGLLDNEDPESAIRRETEEETGYRVGQVKKVFEAYMSPGSVTEKLYFYTAEYSVETKKHKGGGINEEDIEVVELPFARAFEMTRSGEIMDGKTIILLQHLMLSQVNEP